MVPTEEKLTAGEGDAVGFPPINFTPTVSDNYSLVTQDPTFKVNSSKLPFVEDTFEKQRQDFGSKLQATWEQSTAFSNLTQVDRLNTARRSEDAGIPIEDILVGVPDSYKGRIQNEFTKFGSTAAYVYKEQLLEDIKNNKVVDNMPLHHQLGYGALSMLLDPVTFMTGSAVGAAVKTTQASIAAKTTLANTPVGAGALNLFTWGTGAGIEGAVYDTPRIMGGDKEYTANDYYNTIALSTAFGTALTGVFMGASKYINGRELKDSQVQYVKDLQRAVEEDKISKVESGDQTVERVEPVIGDIAEDNTLFEISQPDEINFSSVNEVKEEIKQTFTDKPELQTTIDSVYTKQVETGKFLQQEAVDLETFKEVQAVNLATGTPEAPKRTPEQTFTALEEVKSIDRDMFVNVLNASRKTMDTQRSPVFNLLKRQARLNKITDELPVDDATRYDMRTEVDKLNAEIVKIVSAYPDGKVPSEVAKTINELKTVQQEWVSTNPIEDIVTGEVADATRKLQMYIDRLDTMELWGDSIPTKVSYEELQDILPKYDVNTKAKQSVNDLEGAGKLADTDVAIVKTLEEVRQLNELAKKQGGDFKQLVEELNGRVANRLSQLELGVLDTLQETDKTKWMPSTVKLTPEEIKSKLREEGIDQFSAEYRKAVEEVRVLVKEKQTEQGVADTSKAGQNIRRIEVGKLEARVKSGELTKANPKYTKRKKELEEGKVQVDKEVRKLGKKENIRLQGSLVDDSLDGRYDGGEEVAFTTDSATTKREEFTDELVIDPSGEQFDILPRNINESFKTDAFDNPTPENIRRLRKGLQTRVVSKISKDIDARNKVRDDLSKVMMKVKQGLEINPTKVLKDALDSNKMDSLFLIIRMSNQVAEEAANKVAILKAKQATAKSVATPEQPYVEEPALEREIEELSDIKPLSEKEINEIFNLENIANLTAEQNKRLRSLREVAKQSYAGAVNAKLADIEGALFDYKASGEQAMWVKAREVKSPADWLGRKLSVLTKDIADVMQSSNITSVEFIGQRVTELGRGYGGAEKRAATGGIVKHTVLNELQMEYIPNYVRALHDYAVSRGSNAFQTMNAQQMLGRNNPIVAEFNRDFMYVQEMRRQGLTIPADILDKIKPVTKFIDSWDSMMSKAHKKLVDANIEGFRADRKIPHYVPRVHQYGLYQRAIKEHGLSKVHKLLMTAIKNGDRSQAYNEKTLSKKADEFIAWVNKQDGTTPVEDLFMPALDSRAMSRLDMDMTTEVEGLSMFDLVNTEVVELGTKYANRTAGWAGLSESTGGLLNSNAAIDAYKMVIDAEAKVAGKKSSKHLQHFDDVINMMFGRPTRGGLPEELRMLKDLTALTRMGGLGSAQLIESGQVLTRGVINMFSDPAVAKRLFDIAKEDPNNKTLLHEIQSITKLTDDMEHLQRQSVNLEQSENVKLPTWRRASLQLVDTMTFGKYKAPASRLLGKVTGFNAIRKYQSRVAQTGFVLNAVRHFTNGSSAISPKRLADLGLTDTFGKNDDLADAIKQFVELDSEGFPTKLNVDKWPLHVQKEFTYAMMRDEAQNVQKSIVGELPTWYNKPLMALAFQFRQFPIVAQNKQLGRALAMADKEAVVAVMMNAATSGLVRLSKAAIVAGGIAAVSQREYRTRTDVDHVTLDTAKYVAQFGIIPDAYDFSTKVYKSYSDDELNMDDADTILSFAPMWGLMKDYYDVANPNTAQKERAEAVQGLVPLGNILFADMLAAQITDWIEE